MQKKFEVEITNAAESDLEWIWDYIAPDNPVAALNFLDLLEEKTISLAINPERCPFIPENDHFINGGYRHLIVKDYRIIFAIRGRHFFVLRVFHGAKLLDLGEADIVD